MCLGSSFKMFMCSLRSCRGSASTTWHLAWLRSFIEAIWLGKERAGTCWTPLSSSLKLLSKAGLHRPSVWRCCPLHSLTNSYLLSCWNYSPLHSSLPSGWACKSCLSFLFQCDLWGPQWWYIISKLQLCPTTTAAPIMATNLLTTLNFRWMVAMRHSTDILNGGSNPGCLDHG